MNRLEHVYSKGASPELRELDASELDAVVGGADSYDTTNWGTEDYANFCQGDASCWAIPDGATSDPFAGPSLADQFAGNPGSDAQTGAYGEGSTLPM